MSASRFWLRLPLLLVLGGLPFVACNCDQKVATPVPEDAAGRYAEVVCDAAARCGCIDEAFDGDLDQCLHERVERFEAIQAWPGVEFDPECFEEVLAWLEASECAGVEEWRDAFPPTARRCRVFRGTLDAGRKCAPALYELGGDVQGLDPDSGGLTGGPCRIGTHCYAGQCVSVSSQPTASEGEPCNLALGVRCIGEEGYYCSTEGICRNRAAVGEPCDTPWGCEGFGITTYCSGLSVGSEVAGTCTSKIEPGQPCDPREADNPCAGAFAYCNSGGVCVEDWPAACYMVADPQGAFNAEDYIPI